MHENASAVMPVGVGTEVALLSGANKGHVVDAYNALAPIVLQTLQAQQMVLGVQNTGVVPLGRSTSTHREPTCRRLLLLEGVFNGRGQRPYTGVVRRFVDLNFGYRRRTRGCASP